MPSKLENSIITILLKVGVEPGMVDYCITWAFGPGALDVPIYPDWIRRWHKLHPTAPRIHRKDSFVNVVAAAGVYFLIARGKEGVEGNGKSRFGRG
jgi:hypothetical protein